MSNVFSNISIEGRKYSFFQPLENVLGVVANDIAVIWKPVIARTEDCTQLVDCIKTLSLKLKRPRRFLALQLDDLKQDWGIIRRQHIAWIDALRVNSAAFTVAHLSFPSAPLYYVPDPDMQSRFSQKNILELKINFNAEAWATYAQWMGEEIRSTTKAFQPDALDKYTLQAHLDDFLHEMDSPIFQGLLKEIKKILLAGEEPVIQKDRSRLFELEKQLVQLREELRELLLIQSTILGQIADGIRRIEKDNPELHSLKQSSMLLNLLMNNGASEGHPILNWGQQLLMLQLLNWNLNVVEIISGNVQGLQQIVNIPLALAWFQGAMKQDHLFRCCQNWYRENPQEMEFKDDLQKQINACEEVLKTFLPYPSLETSSTLNSDLSPFFKKMYS